MTVDISTLKPPPQPGILARLRAGGLRTLAIQAIVLLVVGLFVGSIVVNVIGNIARLNLQVGFGFLSRPAGFEIAQTPIAFPEGSTYFRAFLVAFINTALIAVVSIVLSTVLGFFVSVARLSVNPLLSLLAQFYVEMVRNIPLLLQLFFWYFAVLGSLPAPRQSLNAFDVVFLNKRGLFLPTPAPQPDLPVFIATSALFLIAAVALFVSAQRYRVRTGKTSNGRWILGVICLAIPHMLLLAIDQPVTWNLPQLKGFNISGGISIIPEFVAIAVGLSVYGSAFVAELIRGGVETVNRGQTEAGQALGLSRWRIYSKIVIPQALRAIIPPLTGQYITLLKNSSLASAIGYPDLMLIFAGTSLNQTGQPLEIMAMTMASYLFLCLVTAAIGNIVNRRMQLVER